MEMIILPALRLAQLQTVTTSVIEYTENLTEVESEVGKVQSAFTNFQQGMTKGSVASDKKTLDKTRDRLNTGFFTSVEAEQYFPQQEEATQQLLAEVVRITDKYGFGLSRLSYDEQTASTDNMIEELEALDLTSLPTISRWLAPVKAANEDFRQGVKNYLEVLTTSKDTEAAYKAAEPLTDALNELFKMLFAHVKVSNTEPLVSAHKSIATLVDSYR